MCGTAVAPKDLVGIPYDDSKRPYDMKSRGPYFLMILSLARTSV
jgi:hypothetical protein